MSLVEFNDEQHLLGQQEMDQTHREFVALLNQLAETNEPEKFKAIFSKIVEHTEAHFLNERRLMTESDFPALDEHRGEHWRVLSQLRQINAHVQCGRLKLGREYIKELPGWFDLHAVTMDSALAHHLRTQR